MSKQSEAKEKQGFIKKCHSCSNRENFKLDRESYICLGLVKRVESNLRCGIGNFAVKKSNWCNKYERKD